jgi:hypothetical protein
MSPSMKGHEAFSGLDPKTSQLRRDPRFPLFPASFCSTEPWPAHQASSVPTYHGSTVPQGVLSGINASGDTIELSGLCATSPWSVRQHNGPYPESED